MTKTQFEMLTIYLGMLQEGCSKDEALGYVVLMQYEPENLSWLIQKIS